MLEEIQDCQEHTASAASPFGYAWQKPSIRSVSEGAG